MTTPINSEGLPLTSDAAEGVTNASASLAVRVDELVAPLRGPSGYARDIAASKAADRLERYETALKPFADCVDQIADDEDDEEWAKFRLLIKDYRRARKALGDSH